VTRNRLNIIFYDPANLNFPGGGELTLVNMAEKLSQRGHNVKLIYIKYPLHNSYSPSLKNVLQRSDKISFFEAQYIKFPRGFPIPSPLDVGKITKLFNSSDIAYFYVYSPNELFARILKSGLHCPLIGGFHMSIPLARSLIESAYLPIFKRSLRAFDGFRTLNNSTSNLLEKWGCENIHFIPNGVDTEKFSLCENPANSPTFNVLFVGDLIEQKGAKLLFDVIRKIGSNEQRNSDIQFSVVGNGPLAPLFKALSEECNVFNYLGVIPHDAMPNVYQKSHLLLLPSWSEGMPRTVLEAQSCGLPVVGSNIPGISAIVVDKITGILLEIGDLQGYLNIIQFYYKLWRNSPQEYSALNERVRAHLTERFNWQVIVDKLETMFSYTLQRKGRM
jgi:glycosyltransferase involved in cell wall biosynthesis